MNRRWISTLLVPTIALLVIYFSFSREYHAQSTTSVDNLAASGSADVTGETISRAGVRLTTPTTGPIITSGAGDPNGVVTATLGSLRVRTDTASLYQNTDGAMAWSAVGGGGGAASTLGPVTVDAQTTDTHCDVDMAVTNEIDWLYFSPGSSQVANGNPRNLAAGAFGQIDHKRTSNRLAENTFYVWGGATRTFNGVAFGAIFSAPSSDNAAGDTLSAAPVVFTSTGTNGGFGVAWDIPMQAGETGTFTFCTTLLELGLTIDASVDGGAVTATGSRADVGASRHYALVTIPFTIGGSDTRLQIEIDSTYNGGNSEYGPVYVYF